MHNHSRLRRSHICAELVGISWSPKMCSARLRGSNGRTQSSSRALPALLTHIIARLGIISSSSLYLGRSKKCNFTNKATWGTSTKVKLNQECKWHFKLINDASRGLSCKKTNTATSQATENMEIDWICCWWWPSKRVFLCFSMTVCFYYQARDVFACFARLHHKEMTFASRISF